MPRSRYKFLENPTPHFITGTIVNWLPLFASQSVVKIILDSLKFLQDHQRLTLYAYVIMENHLHLIASADNLGREIGDFKSYTARKIIDYFIDRKSERILKQLSYHKLRHRQDRSYQFWQEGSHPEQIQSPEMMVQKIEYLHLNPVKRGYVDDTIHWRYSSARNYAGLKGLLELELFSL